MEKYYTPEIEEFYIGFECEIRNSSDKIYDWEPFKLIGADDAEISGSKMDYSFYELETDLRNEMIRVKYLDKEDIESLGFKSVGGQMISDGREDFEQLYESFGLVILQYTTYNNKLVIKSPNFIRDGSGRFQGYMMYYYGTIKNKSELKKLLKQLCITK